MKPESKLEILKKIYNFYDNYVKKFVFICQPGCHACCTQNVLITSLEALYIILHLENQKILENIKPIQKGLRPHYTTNELAYYCLKKKDVSEEEKTYPQLPCSFLVEGKCLIYSLRPFSCRSFFSQERCDLVGEAVVPPELLTVNLIIMQILEHLDDSGCYGNMNDVISFLKDKTNLETYLKGKKLSLTEGLLPNRPIPGFLYPPEHRKEVANILKQLKEIRAFDPTSLPPLVIPRIF